MRPCGKTEASGLINIQVTYDQIRTFVGNTAGRRPYPGNPPSYADECLQALKTGLYPAVSMKNAEEHDCDHM